MSRIVKAAAVVDDRPPVRKTFADEIEEALPKMSVIKRQLFDYRENPYSDPELLLPDKQGYLDELNRIKVQIEQAKAELRSLGRFFEEDEELAKAGEEDETGGLTLEIAQREAERLMRETRESAEAMMEGFRSEGKRLADEAKNSGYLEGFDMGFAQAQTEFKERGEPKMRELESLLEQISSYREEMLASNERELTELVITVAEKIIGRELKSDPRAVVAMLYQTLDANRREEHIRITVSQDLMPVDAKVSADVLKLITRTAPGAELQTDPSAEEGTCIVETRGGITDVSVGTQLKNVKDLLTD